MTFTVKPTPLCKAEHPEIDGVTCGRPQGHAGSHITADHSVNWGSPAAPPPVGVVATAPQAAGPMCGARHPTGKVCAETDGHAGYHRSADFLLCWGGSLFK